MSLEKAKEYLKAFHMEDKVLVLEESSATVELAAKALGTEPERIAKTLSFWVGEAPVLIVTAGDAKIDNSKYKAKFKKKAKMLKPDEVLSHIGHPVGGVCPFGVASEQTKVYLDVSLKRFDTVFPACGSGNSAIELNCDQLFELAQSDEWIDVCKGWES